MKREPKLRFPEFSGEWEGIILKKACEINPSTKVPNEFLYIDLESVESGKLTKEPIFINREDAPSRAQRLLERNDVLFQTVRPYQMNNYIYKDNAQYPTVASTGYAQLRNNTNNPMFIYQYLYFEKFLHKVLERCTGTNYPAINSSDLGDIEINIPSLPEQQKIADFLSTIDSQLETKEQEIQNLEEMKKGFMQKIFSQEMRFKDEKGEEYPDWEEKKLGEICKFFSGGTPTVSTGKYYGGTIPFIKSGEIHLDKTEVKITELGVKESSAQLVNKGDLLYALYGATSGEVDISKIDGAINQAILCIRSKIIDMKYLMYLLVVEKERILRRFLQGGQGNLSAQIIKELTYFFPSLPEQQKIANFLSLFDEKIEIEKEILETLKEIKKGLLQQMFV